MEPLQLRVVSPEGVEATISTVGSQDGTDDFYSVVTVKGFIRQEKIYGIDPIQSFVLGMKLIEKLTRDTRIGDDGEPVYGASWRIEVETP